MGLFDNNTGDILNGLREPAWKIAQVSPAPASKEETKPEKLAESGLLENPYEDTKASPYWAGCFDGFNEAIKACTPILAAKEVQNKMLKEVAGTYWREVELYQAKVKEQEATIQQQKDRIEEILSQSVV